MLRDWFFGDIFIVGNECIRIISVKLFRKFEVLWCVMYIFVKVVLFRVY